MDAACFHHIFPTKCVQISKGTEGGGPTIDTANIGPLRWEQVAKTMPPPQDARKVQFASVPGEGVPSTTTPFKATYSHHLGGKNAKKLRKRSQVSIVCLEIIMHVCMNAEVINRITTFH